MASWLKLSSWCCFWVQPSTAWGSYQVSLGPWQLVQVLPSRRLNWRPRRLVGTLRAWQLMQRSEVVTSAMPSFLPISLSLGSSFKGLVREAKLWAWGSFSDQVLNSLPICLGGSAGWAAPWHLALAQL